MKVSIILPFRNAAHWIEETIGSILGQSYDDWELIAVNDRSEDDTEALMQEFDDARIKIVQNAGEGIIPALQAGLSHANGEFVTRMDADDLMPSHKLSTLVSNMISGRTIVTGKVRYFSEKDVSNGYRNYERWLNERIEKQDHYDHIYRECVIASPNWLVRRENLDKDGIFQQLNYPEDYDMTFLWKKYGYSILSVDSVTHLWREHPDRTSRNSEVYDQASFFDLKLNWFRQNEKGKTLGVFGTGIKGKRVLQALSEHFEIHWYDHEYERFNTKLEGLEIEDPENCACDLLLLAVYPESKTRLENLVARLGYTFGKTVWYV